MSQQFGAPYGPAVVEELRKSVAEHWKALLVWTLAGALIVGGAAFVVGSSRSSAATVFISPLEANPFSPDPRGQTLTNLETEAQVAQSDAVLERASQAIGGSPSAGQLGRGLVVSIPADSQVLELDLTTSGATNAKLAVDAVAQAYLDVREERATLAISERGKSRDRVSRRRAAQKQSGRLPWQPWQRSRQRSWTLDWHSHRASWRNWGGSRPLLRRRRPTQGRFSHQGRSQASACHWWPCFSGPCWVSSPAWRRSPGVGVSGRCGRMWCLKKDSYRDGPCLSNPRRDASRGRLRVRAV